MFIFKKTKIPEVILITPQIFKDSRGFFMETYKRSEFVANNIQDRFVQSNHSHSTYGVLRGLHYQDRKMGQAKLVRCIRGEIFDVAVDMREDSSTYLLWVSSLLSEKNKNMLYIPVGFAHGFCVLSENAEIVYECSEEYNPESERGVIWNDPILNITWPIYNPILSSKDAMYPTVSNSTKIVNK